MARTSAPAPRAMLYPHTYLEERVAVVDPSQEEKPDSLLQEDSSVETITREELELDILNLAASVTVQTAPQIHASTLSSKRVTTQPSNTAPVAKITSYSQKELERGLKTIFRASCLKRLETFHWMTMRIARAGTATDVLEFFWTEAEYQMSEADAENKAIIKEVFGIEMT